VFFKKYKIKKTLEKTNTLPYVVWIVGIFLIFFLWIQTLTFSNNINFNFDYFTDTTTPFLQATSSGGTEKKKKDLNILLLWRWGGNHDAPDLTDTIILASISTEKKTITLFSIPRDLYIEYEDSYKPSKINKVYEVYKPLGEDIAIEKLKSKITEITGQEIDYYVNVDFEGFEKIIDIVWGVDVTLEKNFVDYKFPDDSLWYTTFILKKWTWTLDGNVALKYARSRHSTSDFDRSLRQQEILSSLKNKILSLWYFKDNKKIRELYSAIQDNIKTDIDISTLLKLAITFKAGGDEKILSFNLNDTCFSWSPICSKGGFLYSPQRDFFWGQSVLLVEWSNINKLSEYWKIETYTSLIFEHQELYTSAIPINIYNSTRRKFLASSLADTLTKYGFNIPEENSIGNIREKKFEKSILYYNGIEETDATLIFLSEALWFDTKKTDSPIYSQDDIRIEIILWNNFEETDFLELSNNSHAL